jgi:2-polyprenyl-3-methyl-5-hydroxy-6-metoxy-1,4-benzoquinol methylase
MKAKDKSYNVTKGPKSNNFANSLPGGYKQLLGHIIKAYDLKIVRAYSKVRFTIININILHILALCLRGQRKVLDLGCGFGLFGCYFSMLYPEISYCGFDVDPDRIEMAKQAAKYLGLHNTEFQCQDARELNLNGKFDAIMMIDLLHHIDDSSKHNLLATCARHLHRDGRLVIKEVTTHPFPKFMFTWALDVLMTRGFDMWYWDEKRFFSVFNNYFHRVDTFPIADWMPYSHVVYLCDNSSQSKQIDTGR